MSERRSGPRVTLELSCLDCVYESAGDSGYNVSCIHPDIGCRYIGYSTWKTPVWCPLRRKALADFVEKLQP